ncbi:MAG: transporter [Nitrospirota bacterium]|jgi:hypothetical protein
MKLRIQDFRFNLLILFLMVAMNFSLSTASYAAHPLVTDDTGTQGKGKFQVEVNTEFTFDKEREDTDDDGVEDTVKVKGSEIATVFTYGAIDNLDIFIEAPYKWSKTKINGVVDPADPSADAKGISDIAIGAKWRFYEHEGLSFGLKPSISLPTGNENKGLGNGRASYEILFISTKEIEPWAFHLNLGYTHNNYKLQADKDAKRRGIWKASLAAEVEVVKDLKIVADTGIERNEEKGKSTHPAFILGGLIYSITESFDVNFGVKGGLNKSADDMAVLAGIAFRF